MGPEKLKDHTPEVGVGMSPAVHATAMSEGKGDIVAGPYAGLYVGAEQPAEKQSQVLTV